jgi:hypothetical protein
MAPKSTLSFTLSELAALTFTPAVEHNCKLSALTSALRSKLGQSINLREALLLAQHEEVCDNWRWLRHDDLRMADSMLQHSSTQRYTYYVFR